MKIFSKRFEPLWNSNKIQIGFNFEFYNSKSRGILKLGQPANLFVLSLYTTMPSFIILDIRKARIYNFKFEVIWKILKSFGINEKGVIWARPLHSGARRLIGPTPLAKRSPLQSRPRVLDAPTVPCRPVPVRPRCSRLSPCRPPFLTAMVFHAARVRWLIPCRIPSTKPSPFLSPLEATLLPRFASRRCSTSLCLYHRRAPATS
jgi:hypothetical protein